MFPKNPNKSFLASIFEQFANYRFKRPSGIPNPALPEGGSTGTGNTNGTSTVTPAANVVLLIRSSCSGGSPVLPSSVTGVGTSGVVESLVKELFVSHLDPQKLYRAILSASSNYANNTCVQVRFYDFFYFPVYLFT